MHIACQEAGTREYDLEYLERLEEFLKANRVNEKWAAVPVERNSRYLTANEKIRLTLEIKRIKDKWHL